MSTSLIAPDILSARPYLLTIDRTSRNLGRFELTSFFASLGSLPAFIADILQHFRPKLRRLDAIVGLDALGFPLAGALGDRLGLPVILARKKGKLALTDGEKLVVGFEDYSVEREGVKGLEIRKDLLKDGMRVIVLDEWIDSGAQMTATCEMLESAGVAVDGIATLQLQEGKHEKAYRVWERWDVFAANRSPVHREDDVK